ncbi:E3 ubiquitin-protein ligase UPL4 [Striga asiatica]|uniref:HECT-type E3 ubiquitin transferase n=1 Tax=Striga asiatica TaxID=4170 RepID=A0A5A7P870_STRAF|nr:E3 ubiquitin-protein ligase UPL4 [Striga asiatica]
MANRGQKRAEVLEELPADKRACSSLDFRPSSSVLPAETPPMAHEPQDADMDTSSSTSGSAKSEGDGEKESPYGSCDSDNSLHDYYTHQSGNDQSKFKKVLSSLSEEVEESGQMTLLMELCELLSFCSDGTLSSHMADSFSPILVKLARHESNPDIMLLAIRAITYLCDQNPRSSSFLVRHDAVPALCQRLIAIEYLDVAEQCLQALEKISREQPLACLQSGAIMAVLSYIDFFSTSVQRVALSTVVNTCKKLSSDYSSLFMDAVPILCNLLQYEDRQGLIGLLVKLASSSAVAFRTLYELDVSKTCKEALSAYALSHGMHSTSMVDGRHSQQKGSLYVCLPLGCGIFDERDFIPPSGSRVGGLVEGLPLEIGVPHCVVWIIEVLKLLNKLLPTITTEHDDQQNSDKEAFLLGHPDVLQRFGIDLLPILIQVVNSGMNLFVCYGCLSVINKLVHCSSSEALHSLLDTVNFPSFLAGAFMRKDQHVILLALQIVDSVMFKLPHIYLNSFIKEGVLFAISVLLSPDKDLKLSPVFDGIRLETDVKQKSASRDVRICPCFTFADGQRSNSSETGMCKLQIITAQDLAKRIWTTYFETESVNPEKGVTDILQKLKNLSNALTALVDKSLEDQSSQQEEEIYDILRQIMSELNEKDSISTFEFVESGIIKALVSYLSHGRHLHGKEDSDKASLLCIMQNRFEVFGRLLLSCADSPREESSLPTLIQRLQSALSSVENFPVITGHAYKRRNSYATVPNGRHVSHACLKVQFMRENGEACLHDYAQDVVNVDPFVPLDEVEGYLRCRLRNDKTKNLTSGSKDSKEKVCSSLTPDSTTSDGHILATKEVQEGKLNEMSSSPEGSPTFANKALDSADEDEIHADLVEQEDCGVGVRQEDGRNISDAVSDNEDESAKLLLFLEGQQLKSELTLYQSILKQQSGTEHEIVPSASLWTRTYKITCKRHTSTSTPNATRVLDEDLCSLLSKRASFFQFPPFYSPMFSEDDFEKSGPAYDILCLLKILEGVNMLRYHLMPREKTYMSAEGKADDLDRLKVVVNEVPANEFVNTKLTEKLEQQMREPVAVSAGAMPAWCTQIMAWCPFLFSFEARFKYFQLTALGRLPAQANPTTDDNALGSSGRQQNHSNSPRKKILVHRDKILESAVQMMGLHARQKAPFEVEYSEEVGTGLGPTLEFYTLVCREFQRSGLGMWRDDTASHQCTGDSKSGISELLASPFGLFPRPWSPLPSTASSIEFSEAIKKFTLLGYMVAKALQDGRVLDLPFSTAFYKLILGKDLTLYDIQSFDPALGKSLLEFQAVIEKRESLMPICGDKSHDVDVLLKDMTIEDLCLDFTLPGYPDYALVPDSKMVNLDNLDEYVTLMVDATTKSGIIRQVEAFKSGFDQVFPITHLKVFTEEELEHLLCGEHVLWNSDELLDHIKFDHGYTISSPPIAHLLEIMQEFNLEQQRAFLQFVTGAPRLPTGGLASLNPKLTIVRKHCSLGMDADLPSVMTCANYLKLPPYSSKVHFILFY